MQTAAVTLNGPDGSSISLSGDTLRIATRLFERTWHVGPQGNLESLSFLDHVTGMQWVSAPWETPAGTNLPRLELRPLSPDAAQAESLIAELLICGDGTEIAYRLQVFPSVRGVRLMRQAARPEPQRTGMDQSARMATGPSGIETTQRPAGQTIPATMRLDAFTLAPQHLRLIQISLQDQTDVHNELLFEREWLLHTAEQTLELSGCLFCLEDPLTGNGLLFCKEAPLPHARPTPGGADLLVQAADRKVALIGPESGAAGGDYPFTVLAYDGGHFGRTAALHAYQRAIRPYVPGRDGLLLSNTWGDRNRDARIAAAFLQQEIEAGSRLGVEVIQVDDGWQAGTSSNSSRATAAGGGVWDGYYAHRQDFWSVHPERFPAGLQPLVEAARKRHMRFGLWFSPDSSNDFANWARDVQTILALHRELGVDYFKVDGVHLRSPAGAQNLQSFFSSVLAQTHGKVVFDLDVTAQVRPGYLGLIHTGPLFVENRYTDWHRYWPHQTLRNVWKLAHYIDPVRLRMEWLNNQRNADKYADDPLAPATYRPDYLFATVMFTSPLGWFEISSLPPSYFAEAAPLIAVWKQHRDRIQRGRILAIGEVPDGVSWTGFVSIDPEGFYLLAFRELNPSPDWHPSLPCLPGAPEPIAAQHLGGDGNVTLGPGTSLQVHIPAPRRFLFAWIPCRQPCRPLSAPAGNA